MTYEQQAHDFIRDWQHGFDNFGAKLMALIAKADMHNRARLRLAFPEEVAAFDKWSNGEGEES